MLDVIIIGGGPAGFTAALYTSRAKLDTLLLERAYYGGQMAIASEMENYPGLESVSGSEVADRMARQAAKFGTKMVMEEVLEVRLDTPVKVVKTDKNTYEARTVILCMGASPRRLGLPNEQQLIGSGVSYCATCDGAFFKDRDVAVVGGGDTAAEDVIYLSRFCRRIYLIHRRDKLRVTKILEDLIFNTANVRSYGIPW
jgi:thioredoxin reductase (NADPH)